MQRKQPLTRLDLTLRGLLAHFLLCLFFAGTAAFITFAAYRYGATWNPADSNNLRQFASTLSQIAFGTVALQLTALGLLFAFPTNPVVTSAKSQGYYFDLCTRILLAMLLWLALAMTCLFTMMSSDPNLTIFCILVGGIVGSLTSTLGSLQKLLIIIYAMQLSSDSDYD